MIFTVKDIEMLLEKAKESQRDLTIIINADGTYEISFNIPTASKITTCYEPYNKQ